MTNLNQDFVPLLDILSPGQTPVVLVDGLDWIELEDLHQRRAELLSRIAHWREAWESLNMAQYGGFYSTDFRSESTDRDGRLAQKSRVNSHKVFINVRLINFSVLGYPESRQGPGQLRTGLSKLEFRFNRKEMRVLAPREQQSV